MFKPPGLVTSESGDVWISQSPTETAARTLRGDALFLPKERIAAFGKGMVPSNAT